MSIEAMKQALEALEEIHPGNMTPMAEEAWNKAITALRQAIEQAEQIVPSAYSNTHQPEPVIDKSAAIRIATALGWTPPRQPLTEQRIQQIWFDNLDGIISFEECVTVIREAEEAHGIKGEA